MRIFALLTVAGLTAPLLAGGDGAQDKKAGGIPAFRAFRALSAQGIKPNRSASVPNPTTVQNAKDLAKLAASEEEIEGLLKEVDFQRQLLLVFAWSGSGQDLLSVKLDKDAKGDLVVFRYKAGLTRDLRTHVRVYALRKEIAWKVEK